MTDEHKQKLVDQQALAAYTLDRHVSVTAGPGAGKTTVLVERYLHILEAADVSIDQIVAITFTNRAANEMRERLRFEIGRLIASSGGPERLRWVQHKRRLEGAFITTVHGFCAGLLKEYPVEAEVDPEFVLLEEYQTALLEEAASEEVLTEAIHSEDQSIVALASGVGRAQLSRALIGIYRALRGFGLSCRELETATAAQHSPDSSYHDALQRLQAAMFSFISWRGLTPAADRRREEAARQWPEIWKMLASGPDSVPIAEFCRRLEVFRESARPTAAGDVAELARELDDLLLKAGLSGLVPQLWFDHHASRFAASVATAVRRVEEGVRERKRRLSALDFDDLQLLVLEMFRRHPETARRAARRFRYFLVDEFQDTNEVQRQLIDSLVLSQQNAANLFIVGDRKQSIYGFRGADVKVFGETSRQIERLGGVQVPLHLNFRSQPPLIHFFNYIFSRIFAVEAGLEPQDLEDLGYVEHESGIPHRPGEDPAPLVELLVDAGDNGSKDEAAEQSARERDARQLAFRILQLVTPPPSRSTDTPPVRQFKFGDIALLFRAMTEVPLYEAQFRRSGIPYQTVQGKGFYDRQEISDLIQLLRFLENTTDDLALAAVLRSPLGGISDNALLALRLGPTDEQDSTGRRDKTDWPDAGLFFALRNHQKVRSIGERDRAAIERAVGFLEDLVKRRNRTAVTELLRYALDRSEYTTVAASAFDGPARLANIGKLCLLAERFESSHPATIRDFVRFVRDFEQVSGRESEGRIDSSADAVTLMTVHQAKGLQFPVVVIPELNRLLQSPVDWFLVDRHFGLSLKIPDGRAGLVAGQTYSRLRDRAKLRDRFESMRLLYVAATRARDRLILSGATRHLDSLETSRESWLAWIWQALGLARNASTGTVTLNDGASYWLGLNLGRGETAPTLTFPSRPGVTADLEILSSRDDLFPLLRALPAVPPSSLGRFSVTQLVNYRRCPRQYYFDRILRAPKPEDFSAWTDSEIPEPPSNLTAAMRGSVIHRFCERYDGSEPRDTETLLAECLEEVLSRYRLQMVSLPAEVDTRKALTDLKRLAETYISSSARSRIDRVGAQSGAAAAGHFPTGVFSERKFRLKLPYGILFGTIDKLLVSAGDAADSLNVEVLDFKTNRFTGTGEALKAQIERTASQYHLQMQAYALAVRRLLPPPLVISATLYFLDPNVEYRLNPDLLDREVTEGEINAVMYEAASRSDAEDFPVRPDRHCWSCNFVGMCRAGREWLSLTTSEK